MHAINSSFAMSAAGRQFQNLLLKDVEETSKVLGGGSYGVVIEVNVRGTKCAAKKIHSFLLQNDHEVSAGVYKHIIHFNCIIFNWPYFAGRIN